MLIGTVGYATHSGLGHLIRDFHRHGIIQRILEIPHPRYVRHPEWYPSKDLCGPEESQRFLQGLDLVLVFENAFNRWDVVRQAVQRGAKFVLVPMMEWSPASARLPVAPDLVLCPSLLDLEYFRDRKCVFLPIPVPDHIQWKQRDKAQIYVHNAGHGQVGYAKGTPEVLAAMQYVKSPLQLLVRGQPNEPRVKELFDKYQGRDPRITFTLADLPDEELFAQGDVYVNAERYNGLSLPLQEARAAGMLVMTTNRFPANSWLPNEPLITPASYNKHRVNQTEFDQATVDPKEIARVMDTWYNHDISAYSLSGKEWGEQHSWQVLKPKYLEVLQSI